MTISPDIAGILFNIPELGFVSIRAGRSIFLPPRYHVWIQRADPVLRYLAAYSSLRGFEGDFFLCLYDGWREYSAPCDNPTFVPWREVDQSRYVGLGSVREPRFIHRFDDGIFPVFPLPVLAFCRHRNDPNTMLIPDPEFLQDEFRDYTEKVAQYDIDWSRKDGSAMYWRGSYRSDRSFSEPSPRHFVTSVGAQWIDARYASDVPISEALRHKYVLDVDGFVNAWSGLYWKLRSNSLPVKLTSHWEQWYYNMIEDRRHLILSGRDLWTTYEELVSDDQRARLIAEEGRALASRLTCRFALEEYVIH